MMAARAPKTPKTKRTVSTKRAANPRAACASRVGNGRSLHAEPINPGGTWARRGREVYNQVLADLGGQGLQSELSLQTIRRATGLVLLAEKAEIALAEGKDIEIDKYVTVINAFNRTAGALGLARRPIDVAPSLEAYLAARATESADDEDDGEASEEVALDE